VIRAVPVIALDLETRDTMAVSRGNTANSAEAEVVDQTRLKTRAKEIPVRDVFVDVAFFHQIGSIKTLVRASLVARFALRSLTMISSPTWPTVWTRMSSGFRTEALVFGTS